SICEAHGIGLPVDCVEMVVEIVRLAGRPSLPAAQGLSDEATKQALAQLEKERQIDPAKLNTPLDAALRVRAATAAEP
ncbi:hypothetical protein, partial [Pseudomonas aeruginosa]|uniref:hypothetical protein n=1 Tax=Pseudomonas aeruginosa TaxID=287 RepID=UPI003978A331